MCCLAHINDIFCQCVSPINYDYNHQSGTHRDLFGIKANHVSLFEHEGYWAKVVQELEREDTTWNHLIRNPLVVTAPKTYIGTLEDV
ncbi:hypothetical protein NIES21_60530 (plasmid) [Anabaenopsis circularis NIES-21]|uniref:Uncharacterized protein n=1 Tax=Anabaenopsis circularis NIES-21 TaxID=1085406 RepID=A0A1Z4GRQ7_9CYAN|nr:hypothetical protein NIES21_60530 [Anabaenopsis circularis NIES-21]